MLLGKKFFSYFIDNTAGTALVSYLEVLLDGCGARNRNSWIVKKYLSGHRVSIDKLK